MTGKSLLCSILVDIYLNSQLIFKDDCSPAACLKIMSCLKLNAIFTNKTLFFMYIKIKHTYWLLLRVEILRAVKTLFYFKDGCLKNQCVGCCLVLNYPRKNTKVS